MSRGPEVVPKIAKRKSLPELVTILSVPVSVGTYGRRVTRFWLLEGQTAKRFVTCNERQQSSSLHPGKHQEQMRWPSTTQSPAATTRFRSYNTLSSVRLLNASSSETRLRFKAAIAFALSVMINMQLCLHSRKIQFLTFIFSSHSIIEPSFVEAARSFPSLL